MERIWWERVPNAIQLFQELKKRLVDEESVVLQGDGTIPWKNYFLTELKLSVREVNSTKRFQDVGIIKDKPGRLFYNEFCKPEIRFRYRPSETYAGFLAKEDEASLHEMYIWTESDNPEQLSELITFVSSYVSGRGRKAKAAFFITYTGGKEKKPKQKKGVSIVRFHDYITPYDKRVFCTLASSSIKESLFVKSYLAELASSVLGNDIEFCAECICQYKRFLSDPFKTITEAANICRRRDGTELLKKTDKEFIHDIWEAQIRTIYPALELFRERLIKNHEKEIKKELPMPTKIPGEYYMEPMDVELGTLRQLVGQRKIALSEKEYADLSNHWKARNKLSHLKPLSFEEIKELDIY